MSTLYKIKMVMKAEKFNANKGGSAISYFMKRHPEIVSYLRDDFMKRFPCFEKESEVLSWIQNGLKIKRCLNCGKRLTYTNSRKGGSVACSKECSKSEICRKHKSDNRVKSIVEKCGEYVNPFQMDWVKEKIKQTNLEKYGAENPMQNKEIATRSGLTHKTKHDISKNQLDAGYIRFLERLERANITFLGNRDDYIGVTNGTVYNLKCNECGHSFHYKYNNSKNINFACPFCYPSNRSLAEREVANFVEQYVEIYINDRTILSDSFNPELDIYIPSKKIAIEYNGLFWHSHSQGKDRNYHLQKTELCESKGVHLIQIFEDEWKDKQQIVKNRLRNILGVTPYRIFARKCEVRHVENSIAKNFLEKYHIQGNCNSSVRLGLFYKNRLVALMTFGKSRFNKSFEWELLRYVTVGSFNVIGGAGKLLSYFRKNYIGSIISYADRRWSQGNLYKSLGFTLLQLSTPAYFYVKDGIRFSRIKFQKHKLKDELEIFDENLSEKENMENNGYFQVWDCGNKVFVLL